MTMNLTPQRILSMLLRHIKLMILITLLVTVLVYGYTAFFITPTYSTSALIMVQNYDSDDNSIMNNSNSTGRVNTSDISASATLANYCVVLFNNSPDMTSLMTCGVSISLVEENNNFIKITTYSSNPTESAKVANDLAAQSKECFEDFFEYGKLSVIREASVPSSPSAPDVPQKVTQGFLIGLVLAVLIAFFIEIIDTTIKPDDDLEKLYDVPVFAEVVDFSQEG